MIKKLNISAYEIDKIMEIWKESTIKAHEFISEEYWLENYKVVKEKYIPIAETYVYMEGNEIRGFISILDGGYIGALFVDIKMQGKGIGKKLVQHTEDIYDNLTLEVYKKNEQAVAFYKKVGFIISDEHIDEQTKEPAYTMTFQKQ